MVAAILGIFTVPVYASSQQAYKDYLYQYDVYRSLASDFQTARNEYIHFQTLSSQTTAFEKTKTYLVQRDNLMKSYLLLLSEKLDENTGVSSEDKGKYQQLMASESAFLVSHAQQIPGTSSLNEAIAQSPLFEDHYKTLQRNIRRVLITIALGQLTLLHDSVRSVTTASQSIFNANMGILTPQKQATITQWMIQIQNKENVYQQKYKVLADENAILDGFDVPDLDRNYNDILKGITDARQNLADTASYLKELKNALQFIE
jgi:hypothetical protein